MFPIPCLSSAIITKWLPCAIMIHYQLLNISLHWWNLHPLKQIFYLFKDCIYLFLERGREEEKDGEEHQCVVASCVHLTGDLAYNSGMCPDWELNRWPFGWQASTQSTEPHQPELKHIIFKRQLYINTVNGKCNITYSKERIAIKIKTIQAQVVKIFLQLPADTEPKVSILLLKIKIIKN